MNLEKQKENFKNHRAIFKNLGNIKILDFKKPNSTEYRIRFLFEEDYCRLHISGDLGELIAMNYRNMCWNQFDDFVNDIDYFQEKILCHSRPFFVYDQEQAEEDITKYIEEYNLYDDILSNGYDFLCDKTEVIEAFLTDVLWDFTLETGIGSNGYDKFSEIDGDICDIISDFGKRETGILDLYMLAFKLAKEQLKISKED